MTILIQVEGLAGSTITNVLIECQQLAKQLDVGITTTFNGFALTIFDHSNLKDIEDRYHNWCREQSKQFQNGRYDNG